MIPSNIGIACLVICSAACAGPVSVLGRDDRPTPPPAHPVDAAVHAHNDTTIELPEDALSVEPAQPTVGSLQERALAHVHTPKGGCSGVVIAPQIVLTAHQCIGGEADGIVTIASGASGAPAATGASSASSLPDSQFYLEVATSASTWTRRQISFVITPACAWERLDMAALVVSEPIEWVKPLTVSPSPAPGQNLQALGFGHCAGETHGITNRFGALTRRESDALVIDVPLCRGDVGGPLVDPRSGALFGIISHQDDPDNAPRHTTTGYRLDTNTARAVVAQASALVAHPEVKQREAVACE